MLMMKPIVGWTELYVLVVFYPSCFYYRRYVNRKLETAKWEEGSCGGGHIVLHRSHERLKVRERREHAVGCPVKHIYKVLVLYLRASQEFSIWLRLS